MNQADVKVAICIPTRELMHSRCSFSLYNLAIELSAYNIEHRLFLSPGTLIANQRHELVKVAKEWGATHVMFIDSDIVFEPSHVISLIEFNEPIVGAAYSKRIEPLITTAWHKIGDWSTHVVLTEQTDSHIQVEAMALGFCLIKTSVFDELELPWFILGFHNGEYTGEDIEFFRKCFAADIPVWLDVKTSLEIGHLGIKEYKNSDDVSVSFAT
jgi:hypothetical protein